MTPTVFLHRHKSAMLLLAGIITLLSACGQKGPLTLPGKADSDLPNSTSTHNNRNSTDSKTSSSKSSDTQHNDKQRGTQPGAELPATDTAPATTE